MTLREGIQIAGPIVTLAGVWFGMWGTFLMTRQYHVANKLRFFFSALSIASLLSVGNSRAANSLTANEADAGEINHEIRAVSLQGIYLVFIGFLLQGFGAAFWLSDTVWGFVAAHTKTVP